jgi:hypothetical protein
MAEDGGVRGAFNIVGEVVFFKVFFSLSSDSHTFPFLVIVMSIFSLSNLKCVVLFLFPCRIGLILTNPSHVCPLITGLSCGGYLYGMEKSDPITWTVLVSVVYLMALFYTCISSPLKFVG